MTERFRPCCGETLARFVGQSRHPPVINVLRQPQRLLARVFFDLALLPLDIALVLGAHLELQRDLLNLFGGPRSVILRRAHGGQSGHVAIRNPGPAQQVDGAAFSRDRLPQQRLIIRRKRVRMDHCCRQPAALGVNGLPFARERCPAVIINQAELPAHRGQSIVRVVFAQQQAVFGAARKHAIRLTDATSNQVVDQHAEVGFVTLRIPARQFPRLSRGIDAGQQALRRGFFIAGGAVDLPREEQPGDQFCLERRSQVARIEIVVLDRIARLRDRRIFKAGNGPYEFDLHFVRQAGRDAVRVHHVGGQAFGFDEHLVRALVREAHDLVFHGRAIARSHTLDVSAEHRGLVQ